MFFYAARVSPLRPIHTNPTPTHTHPATRIATGTCRVPATRLIQPTAAPKAAIAATAASR